MPLPSNNKRFESGDLSGYLSNGLVTAERFFRDDEYGDQYHPLDGQFFARLDDPRSFRPSEPTLPYAVTFDGERTTAAKNAAADTGYIKLPHDDGSVTHGADGAWLEFTETIPKTSALWLRFAFIDYDVMPYNDFAVLEATFADGTLERTIICDIASVAVHRLRRNTANFWDTFFWQPKKNFNGTLRVVMSNGQMRRTASGRGSRPTIERFARPSCLLIDALDVIPL
jgi:hypothetical protein